MQTETFTCPKCGGHHFGRVVASLQPFKFGKVQCHDEHSIGCNWEGDFDFFGSTQNTQQKETSNARISNQVDLGADHHNSAR